MDFILEDPFDPRQVRCLVLLFILFLQRVYFNFSGVLVHIEAKGDFIKVEVEDFSVDLLGEAFLEYFVLMIFILLVEQPFHNFILFFKDARERIECEEWEVSEVYIYLLFNVVVDSIEHALLGETIVAHLSG
jgi:hypothetical protein